MRFSRCWYVTMFGAAPLYAAGYLGSSAYSAYKSATARPTPIGLKNVVNRPTSKPKKGAAGVTKASQSMAPRSRARRAPVRKRSLKRKAPKRKGTVRRSAKKRRIGRKPVSAKKLAYSTKRKFDDHGDYTRATCAWVGFQTHGSKFRVWDALGESLTRTILATVKVFPKTYDQNITSQMTTVNGPQRVLYLRFRRILDVGGADQIITATGHDLATLATFKSLSDSVGAQIEDYANYAGIGTAPVADSVGYYPYEFYFTGTGAQINDGTPNRELGNSMLDMNVTQSINIRNITPSDSASKDKNQIDVNPIKGKVYHFKQDAPILRDSVIGAHPGYSAFQNRSPASGIQTGPVVASASEPIGTAPHAKELFDNCSSVQDIYIGAGSSKTITTQWQFKGNLKSFVDKFYFSGYQRGKFGGCSWFAMHNANRTGSADPVKVSISRTVVMGSRLELKRDKVLMTHFEDNAVTL